MADSKHLDEAMVEFGGSRWMTPEEIAEWQSSSANSEPMVKRIAAMIEPHIAEDDWSDGLHIKLAQNISSLVTRPAVFSLGDDEMVERVARAIEAETGYSGDIARRQARAAIAAMTG